MDLKVKKTVNAYTDDGKELEKGKTYAFDLNDGRCILGVFDGFSQRSALAFVSFISDDVKFNIMPKCIERIYEVDVEVV